MFSKVILSALLLASTIQANAATHTFNCQKDGESYVLIVAYEPPEPTKESVGNLILIDSKGSAVYKNKILLDEFSTPTRCGSVYSLEGENASGDIVSIYKEWKSQACGGNSTNRKGATVNALSCW